jgi:hypothetical protein
LPNLSLSLKCKQTSGFRQHAMSDPKSASTPKKPSEKAAASKASGPVPGTGQAACASFEWTGSQGGIVRPVWIAPQGGLTMIDLQKGRNNYYKLDVRTQASICRRSATGSCGR